MLRASDAATTTAPEYPPQNEIRHNVKKIAENLKQDDFLLFVLQRAESKKNHPEKR